jgi:CRP/FNR family cyclic AMP-dependent transcriptional regulator
VPVRKVLFILGQLSDSDSEWLAKAGQLVRIPAGAELIREGAPVDSMYLLIDGELKVHMKKLGDIAQLGAGEIVGELSLVDSRAASASVIALRPCAVLKVDKARLLEKIELDEGFGVRFYRAISIFLADRMRSTIEKMGYGSAAGPARLGEEAQAEGEIDIDVLDRVHLAGARFERIFKSMLDGAPAAP